jgi:segregation and condensation protein A
LFGDLFEPLAGRPELVVTFLALLELTRERLVEIVQTAPFAPIHARLRLADADQ